MIAYCLGLLRLFLSPFLFLMVSLVFQFRKLLTESMFQPLKKDRSDSDLTAATQAVQLDTDELTTVSDDGSLKLRAPNTDIDIDDLDNHHDDEHVTKSKNNTIVSHGVQDVESEMNLDFDSNPRHNEFTESSHKFAMNTCGEDIESGAIIDTNDNNSTDDTSKETITYALDVETGELQLPNGKRFPNSCAVCLCPYYPDERIIWSSNPDCQHAFHSECIVEWLVKMQDGSPCPCCRQEFVELGPRMKKKGERTRDWSIRSVVSSVQASMRYSSLR